jgi:hypothetical protein
MELLRYGRNNLGPATIQGQNGDSGDTSIRTKQQIHRLAVLVDRPIEKMPPAPDLNTSHPRASKLIGGLYSFTADSVLYGADYGGQHLFDVGRLSATSTTGDQGSQFARSSRARVEAAVGVVRSI